MRARRRAPSWPPSTALYQLDRHIWGLGFWKDKIFGFTSNHQFVLFDPKTGSAQVVNTGNVSWWGAGVTTLAPVLK